MRVGHEASSPKNDIRLINLQYKIGKLIGFNPMSCHKELFLSKLYVFILFFSFLSLTICTITIKYLHYRQTDFLEDLLDLLECLSELLFVSACFTSSSFKKWRRILDLVNLCERKFNQQNLVVKNTTTKWILQIAFYHLLLVALHAFENYLWIMNNEFGLVYGFVSFRIALYYQFFSLTYICSFCQMLKRRYQYLSKLTSEIFENRNGNGNGNNKVYESELMYKLRRVVSIHRSLYVMVQQLNDIFGWQIFLILENIVISLMNSANFALNSLNESNDYSLEERILYSGIYPCIYIIATIVLVMFCDAVEGSSRNVTLVCFRGLEVIENSTLRDELSCTAKCMKKLTAKISAAGFFYVNRHLSATLFTSIITYLIIVVQFHISTRKIQTEV